MKPIALLIALATLLSACNTFEGVGRDVRSAGEWTSDSARTVKNKIDGQ